MVGLLSKSPIYCTTMSKDLEKSCGNKLVSLLILHRYL